MRCSAGYALALVTAPDIRTARSLAAAALKARLVACANIVRGLESHYWWQGKIETGTEVLLLLKTTSARLAALQNLIVSRHPYDTPEFVVVKIHSGHRKYLRWLSDSVAVPKRLESARSKAVAQTHAVLVQAHSHC